MSDSDDEPTGEIDKRITRAIKFMHRVSENDSVNRVNALKWRKFRYGEQWPQEIETQRTIEARPCITVNKTDTYCLHVENQQRQQRPRIKVDPTNGQATKKAADIIKGMIRHIESTRGGADMAYDGGFSGAGTEGVGYWRVMSDYVSDDSFEQELFLMPIDDPLTVYFDDHSIMPDGSDNEETLIVSDMSKSVFKDTNPDADPGENFIPADVGGGATNGDWVTKETVRVAEYFYIERDRQMVYKLPDGTTAWGDKLHPDDRKELDDAIEAGVRDVGKRESSRKTVKWCKLTALDILEERDLPGKWIPVFPCYGRNAIIDGKRRRFGLVKNAVGPQMMSNFWKSAMTESVALGPKAKWVMVEGQDEGHVNEWATANTSTRQTLRYKPVDVAGNPAPPPTRVQPEPPPEGAMAMAQSVDQDLSAVLGIVDPAQRISGNVSGKALQGERLQSEQNTFHLYDNMTRSIAFTGRYLLDVIPYYYPEPSRVVRIIGDDGKSKTQSINQPHHDDPSKILNDVTVGQYDVVMDAGPGYQTRRKEAVDSMLPLFEKNEKLMETAGDVMFRNMDFQGAEVIADRLAAANPLSQVDEDSDIPPAIQVKLKQADQTIKQLQGELQKAGMLLKSRADVESMKEAAASHRLDIAESAKTARNTDDNAAWMHDVHTKTMASLSVAEINAVKELLKTKVNNEHDLKTLDKMSKQEDAEIAPL